MFYDYFRLRFEKPPKGMPAMPEAQLYLWKLRLFGDCVTADEFDWQADRLIKEIECLKRQARKKFTSWEKQDEARRRTRKVVDD